MTIVATKPLSKLSGNQSARRWAPATGELAEDATLVAIGTLLKRGRPISHKGMDGLHTDGRLVWLYPSSAFNYVRLSLKENYKGGDPGDIVDYFTDRLIAQ